MADVLVKPAFVPTQPDTGDTTRLGPNAWVAPRLFSGGNTGDLIVRDPTSLTGAKWLSVLTSLSFSSVFTDPVFTGGVLTGPSRLREAQTITVRANDGGQFGLAGGNSSHGALFLDLQSITPTELVGLNYAITNYSTGDAGFSAGSTEGYGQALVRGVEHTSLLGHAQFQATLTTGSLGATALGYTSPTNESTLGVGRDLIDRTIALTGSVASFAGTGVVGSGTSWGASLVGQFFKMDVDDRVLGGITAGTWYAITAVTDTTHLTLEYAYSGGATSGASTISPGAKVTAFNSTSRICTVESNAVAWAVGHVVALRIYAFSQLTPYFGVVQRTLPYINAADAAFTADSSASAETVGAAFVVTAGSKFDAVLQASGTSNVGINFGPLTVTSATVIQLPMDKFIRWGGSVAPSNPGIGVDAATGSVLIKAYASFHVQKADNATERLLVNVDTGLVSVGLLANTGYYEGTEMTAPAAGAVNTGRLYFEDNGSGKTRLMCLFNTGAAQQVALQP